MSDITFTIDAKDNASRILQGLMGNFGEFGRILNDLGSGNFEGAVISGVTAIMDIEKQAIAAASEHETTLAKLKGTLESTGRASEISAGQLGQSASALASMSTFDDDAILSAYTAIAKFQDIPTSAMDDIATAAANMTAVLGGDLAGNAETIARVLETGLVPRTWGWNDALKAQVKDLVDAGDKGGALSLIMENLNKQYGGQAAAQLGTYAGQVKSLKNNWGEILETLGGAQMKSGTGIVSELNKAAIAMNQLLTILGRASEAGKSHGNIKWWEWIFPPVGAVHGLVNGVQGFIDVLNGKFVDSADNAAAAAGDFAAAEDEAGESASDAAVAVEDLSNKYSSISGYAQDLTKSLQDITAAKKAQADALAAHGIDSQEYIDATTAVKDLETAQKHQTDMWVLDVITQQLMTDGLTSTEMAYLLQYQVDTGIITEEAKDRAQSAYDYALALAAIPSEVNTDINTHHNDFYWNNGGGNNQMAPNGPGHYAGGADFIVPPGYPNDSFPMRVQSGEHVQVTPASNTYQFNITNPTPEAAEASINRAMIKLNYLGYS